MAETRVTTAKLRESANQLSQYASMFQNQYQELFAYGKELDGTWDGDANDTFNAQMGSDQPKFDNMHKTVMDYVKALNETAALYDKAENDALNAISNRKVK